MKNRLILVPLLLFFSIAGFGQILDKSTTTKKNGWHNISYDQFITNDTLHRWQVGINTQFFTDGLYDDANDIFDSQLTPIEFMLRMQTALNQAMRLRVFGMSDYFKRDDSATKIEIDKSILGIVLGYEWQMLLGKRWKWYYGLDAQVRRMWDDSKEVGQRFYNSNTNETFIRDVFINRTTDRISLLPLLGIRFHITPRVFVSTELKIEAFYEKFSYEDYSKNIKLEGSPPTTIASKTSLDGFSIENTGITFQPYTGIYLNLTF